MGLRSISFSQHQDKKGLRLALEHPYKEDLLGHVGHLFEQLSRTEPHNRRSDQVLLFLLQNTLRVALRRFARAELSRGQ